MNIRPAGQERRVAADHLVQLDVGLDAVDHDLGQRAAYVLSAWIDYYRYTGDAAAIAHITAQADALKQWPRVWVEEVEKTLAQNPNRRRQPALVEVPEE